MTVDFLLRGEKPILHREIDCVFEKKICIWVNALDVDIYSKGTTQQVGKILTCRPYFIN